VEIIPTSWDALDWDDINPWDRRYYLSLHSAMQERAYRMRLTPVIDNWLGGRQTTARWRSPFLQGVRNYGDTSRFDFFSSYRAEGCLYLFQLLLNLIGQMYQLEWRYDNWSSPYYSYKYGYFPDLESYKPHQINNFDILIKSENYVDIFNYPTWGQPIDEHTVIWLQAMKRAIQSLRYIEINGCTFTKWDRGYATRYPKVSIGGGRYEYYTLEDVATIAANNMISRAFEVDAHGYDEDSAFIWADYRMGRDNPAYQHRVEIQARDIRWKNCLRYPVDVYAKIYEYRNPLNELGTNKIYHDFGTDFENGEIRFLQTVQPGEEIDGILDGVSVLPLGVPLPEPTENMYYSIGIKLLGDVGDYFNFKS
jgi:hypothetical protein